MPMRKILFILSLLVCLSFCTSEIEEEVGQWKNILEALIIPLAILLTVIAGVVYMAGQLFGAEMRARASVYASNLIIAAGIAVAILIIFEVLLPIFTGGSFGGYSVDIGRIIDMLRRYAESFLVFLIMLLVVLSAVVFTFGNLSDSQTRARANVWATSMLTGAILASILYVLITMIIPHFSGIIVGLPFGSLAIYPMVIISVVLLVSFVILIVYLLSKVFKLPEWEAYINVEMSQLMNSFLVMIFIVAAFATAQAIVISFSGSDLSPPLAAAQFLREWVADSVLSGLFDVLKIQACTSMLSTVSRRMGEAVMTSVYKIFPGVDTFVSISNTLLFGFMSAYGSISVQVMILNFLEFITIPILFPAGLFLRFFPPTRDAGSFLIAMAFSFNVVFPMTFLIHEKVLEELHVERYNSPEGLISSLCGPFKYGVAGFLFGSGNPLFRSSILAPVGSLLGVLASETLLNIVGMAEFLTIMRTVSLLSLLALFMPGLSTVITIAFINGLSKFLVAKM